MSPARRPVIPQPLQGKGWGTQHPGHAYPTQKAGSCKHGTRHPAPRHAYPTHKAGLCKHGTRHVTRPVVAMPALTLGHATRPR